MKTGDYLERKTRGLGPVGIALRRIEHRAKSPIRKEGAKLVKLSELYRAACSDLAMADVYQLHKPTSSICTGW